MKLARSALRGWIGTIAILWTACSPDVEFRPDETLRTELGLTSRDEVHTVSITGGEVELPVPSVTNLPPGAFVQFVSADWLVHEIIFEADSLRTASLEFMRRNDQMTSPPLLQQGSRFLVTFVDAPVGRYPFRLEGNGGSARGVVVVSDSAGGKR